MINTSIDKEFTQCFEKLYDDTIDKNSIKYFCPLINANEFEYEYMIKKLLQYAPNYCLSRSTLEENSSNPLLLSQLTRDKFRELDKNEGELAELMGYSFLESDLGAPKIISKMELKTDNNMYFNGADGVHYLKTTDGYQLIFVEAKTYDDLYNAIWNSISSVDKFKNNSIKDEKDGKLKGIKFEKTLISANIMKEVFSEEDKQFIKDILYPRRDGIGPVDTSFSIIILYEPKLDKNLKSLPNQEYREKVHEVLKSQIINQTKNVKSLIEKHKLHGHNFYFYIVPLDDLYNTRHSVLKEVLR